MRIAVDAMGCDAGPAVLIDGALEASRLLKPHKVVLVGDEKIIQEHLLACGYRGTNFEIVHAPEVIGMHEKPMEALRRKKRSSVRVAAELVKERRADAMISAGNTGAAVAASWLSLGFLPGVRRAGIATPLPTSQGGVCVLIDAGANMSPAPVHLLQYAVMAQAYSKIAFKVERPRVGLLNVGEEDAKGNVLARETYNLLKNSQLDFCGNVEGRDIFEGTCDIVVCDGFVGNALLKASEGLAETVLEHLRTELSKTIRRRLGAFLCRNAFRGIKSKLDCSEYGGAPLLGVNGITIISHGGSNAKAVLNAVRLAARLGEMALNDMIMEGIRAAVEASEG